MATIKLIAKEYSDIEYVKGVASGNYVMERALYKHCKVYFDRQYRGVFFANDEDKQDIFQEAFITLWQNILKGKIRVEDGQLKGRDGMPFTSTLTSYFMGIAKIKNLEWVRKNGPVIIMTEEERRWGADELSAVIDIHYGERDDVMLEIIAECISHISERCNQILSMFFYQELPLDAILKALPTFTSKDALKTAKYKCLETLRKTANEMYDNYQNT